MGPSNAQRQRAAKKGARCLRSRYALRCPGVFVGHLPCFTSYSDTSEGSDKRQLASCARRLSGFKLGPCRRVATHEPSGHPRAAGTRQDANRYARCTARISGKGPPPASRQPGAPRHVSWLFLDTRDMSLRCAPGFHGLPMWTRLHDRKRCGQQDAVSPLPQNVAERGRAKLLGFAIPQAGAHGDKPGSSLKGGAVRAPHCFGPFWGRTIRVPAVVCAMKS